MSRSNHHFLALLPLFSILTMSPMQIESKFNSRSIASEVIVAHPKYEARAAKIDRTKIEIDKDLDLTCFSERGEALRTRLLQERKDYKVDLVEKDGVAAQRARLDGLVSSLVDLEVDMAALKEKKAWASQQAEGEPNVGEEIANKTMAELKTTLESLLQDEIENELAVLKEKVKADEAAAVTPPVVVKEEDKPKTKEEELLCELEEKNKLLSKQVEDLLAEQKKIVDSMMGMSNMMVQMNQQMQMQQQMPQQQQYIIPSWLMQGSMMNPQLQYPYLPGQGAGSWIYYPQSVMPQVQQDMMGGTQQQPQQQQPQLGQQQYQQNFNSPQYTYPQPQYPTVPSYYQPQQPQYTAGTFGSDPNSFNFGTAPFYSPYQTM